MRYSALLPALCLIASAPAFGAQNSGMADAANGFYAAYESLTPMNGIPDGKARARLEPFFSPALTRALADAAKAQKQFRAANKNAPPLLEGDIFTSHFEGATAFRLGVCTTDAQEAKARAGQCAVALDYVKGQAQPLHWTDTLYLVRTAQGWRVDDIGYGGRWRYANQGRLRATLAMVTTMAQ